jgi:hypothetical protein
MSLTRKWMELEIIRLSEVSQNGEGQISHAVSEMRNLVLKNG